MQLEALDSRQFGRLITFGSLTLSQFRSRHEVDYVASCNDLRTLVSSRTSTEHVQSIYAILDITAYLDGKVLETMHY
jgi:hypothetical protein